MPFIKNFIANEKEIDLSSFILPDEGEEKTFITIKKMDVLLKKKVQILSWEKLGSKASKELIKQIEKSGKKIDELTKDDAVKLFFDGDFNIEDRKNLMDFSTDIQKAVFEKCIDPEKHNFYDDNEKHKKIKINNYQFWNSIGNENLIEFIFEEIKNFSDNFFLTSIGQNGTKTSNGQS